MVHDLESGCSLNTCSHPHTPLCAHTRAHTHVHTSDDGEDTSKAVLTAAQLCLEKIIMKGEGNQNFPLLLIPSTIKSLVWDTLWQVDLTPKDINLLSLSLGK